MNDPMPGATCPECDHNPMRKCHLCPGNCATCEHAGLTARLLFTADYEWLRDQRDELLAALKEMVASYDGLRDHITSGTVLRKLDAADVAIARAEG